MCPCCQGGVCLRRVAASESGSETRYFVFGGQACAAEPGAPIPACVQAAAARIPSPFFSVDVARTTYGQELIVEIGDGQVSDLVGWTPERFAQLFAGV